MTYERPITDLRDKHKGYDIFVIAAGPSVDFIDPSFLDNKIAIGVNESWLRFPNVDYLVRKEAVRSAAAYATGIPLILSKYDCGNRKGRRNQFSGPFSYWIFDHAQNGLADIDLATVGTDKIVVSWSTITSAIHIAAYMGAANVLLIGHDCGRIDGRSKMTGYPVAGMGDSGYDHWLTLIEPQTLALRSQLEKVYNCRTYSINPFVNFGLEGHRYER